MSQPDEWDCSYYGPEGRRLGAVCFVAKERACPTLAACELAIAGSRKRIFRRIQELAASGQPESVYLAGEFTRPDQLLGGDDDDG